MTFDAHPKTFGDLLGHMQKKRVIVPKYQRAYSWTATNVSTFWEDIHSFRNERSTKNPTYFMGPIVTQSELTKVVLLDGQQRLATITILLAVLRNYCRSIATSDATDLARDIQRELIEKKDRSLALELNETDQEFFRKAVQSDPPVKLPARLRSHGLISKAQEYLSDAVTTEIGTLTPTKAVEAINEFKELIESYLIMVGIEVQSEDDAYQIFETLNDRGLRLSVPDLLLNYLMGQAKKEGDKKSVRKSWNAMLERLLRRDIDRFLRHMWISKYGDVKGEGLFRAIKKQLKREDFSSVTFAAACEEECDNYNSILELDDAVLGKNALDSVRALVKQLDPSVSLPLLLSAVKCLERPALASLASSAATLVVRHRVIGNKNPNEIESVLFAAARKIRDDHHKKKPAQKSLAEITEEFRKINPSDAALLPAFKDLMVDKRSAQLLLGTLANTDLSENKEIAVDKANVEHIFPQKPKPSDWPKAAEMEDLLWSLGNLTILSDKLNSGAGNVGFKKKAADFYRKSKIKMTKQLPEDYSEWNRDSIQDRAVKLSLPILSCWKAV